MRTRFQQPPIIIIGAPRSGTNILRDVLTALPDLTTWPCDEINYIWRYGNANHPSDELTPEHATNDVRSYVRKAFESVSSSSGGRRLVEKTCANSLRLDFVRCVIPEANFIFLVRDGRDAIASTLAQWHSSPRMTYLLKKARYVPVRDLPHYAGSFLASQWTRLTSTDKRWGTWGPRFRSIDDELMRRSLPEVCAMQWAHCVRRAADAMAGIPHAQRIKLRYEDFVADPVKQLTALADHFEIAADRSSLHSISSNVSSSSVGKWSRSVDSAQMANAMTFANSILDGSSLPSDAAEALVA